MPRPKKIVAAVVEEETLLDIIELPDIQEDDEEIVDEIVVPVVEEPKPAPVKAKAIEPDPVAQYNVYENETLIAVVNDGSPELMSYLEVNHNLLKISRIWLLRA